MTTSSAPTEILIYHPLYEVSDGALPWLGGPGVTLTFSIHRDNTSCVPCQHENDMNVASVVRPLDLVTEGDALHHLVVGRMSLAFPVVHLFRERYEGGPKLRYRDAPKVHSVLRVAGDLEPLDNPRTSVRLDSIDLGGFLVRQIITVEDFPYEVVFQPRVSDILVDSLDDVTRPAWIPKRRVKIRFLHEAS